MKIGAWIHGHDDIPLDEQITLAAQNGLETIRSYSLDYAVKWNVEQSPIHVAFGLCDRFGAPKFDIKALTRK